MTQSITPTITIPFDIMQQLNAYVQACSKEISGLGSIVYSKAENSFRVCKIYLLEQEVGSAHTDLDDNSVAKLLYEHAVSGEQGELQFWWHSHVNMPTFWSGTDHATMDAIGANGLCIAVVLNKKEESRGAIVMNSKDKPNIKFDDVQILIEYPDTVDYDFIKSQIAEKVKEKTFKYQYSGATNDTGFHDRYKWDHKEGCYVDRATNKPYIDKSKDTATDKTTVQLDLYKTLEEQALHEWKSMTKAEKGYYKHVFANYLEEVEEEFNAGWRSH